MSALNPNNLNGGGKGDFKFLTHTPPRVNVEQPAELSSKAYDGNSFNLTQKGDTARPAPKSVNDFDPRIAA